MKPMVALLFAAGTIYVWKRHSRGAFKMAFVPLLLWLGLQSIELSHAHARYAPLYSRKSVFGFAHELPVMGRLRELQASSAAVVPLRVMVHWVLAPPNFGTRDRWTHVDSYTALFLGRPWNYLHHVIGEKASPIQNAYLPEDFYRQPPFSIPNLGIDLTADYATGAVLVNTNPVPRLWLTFQPRLVESPAEALAAASRRLDLPREGVIESVLPFPAQPGVGEASGTATILRYGHSEIEVACRLSHPGVLVLNEAWFPGWHTEVAGQRIESQPVNYWMRGFALPAGEHTLKLKFRPRSFTEAAVLSVTSLGLLYYVLARGGRTGKAPEDLKLSDRNPM